MKEQIKPTTAAVLIQCAVVAQLACWIPLFLGPSLSAQEPVDNSPQQLAPLFDGQSLNGWTVRGGTATYRVQNGMIVGQTTEGSPNTFLCTDREYANFELQLEVKCDPALNSGIQIRSHVYQEDTPQASQPQRLRKAAEVYGYQCEISSKEKGTSGNFWDEARRTKWLDDWTDKPAAKKALKEGQWNQYRILAEGDHVRSWVNGTPCADFRDSQDTSGFIGLQVHSIKRGAGPYQVRWRNIRIRELSVKPGINRSFEQPSVASFIERWEKEGREVYDKRQQIVAACQLKPGMRIADIGAGTGLFTRLFATAVGDSGKVFAVDIADEFVRHVESSCQQAGISNVQGIVCTQTDTNLPANSVDVAFVCAAYHHFEFPFHTLRSIRRALRPGGRLVVIDFKRIEGVTSEWLLNHVRAGQEVVTKEILAAGFRQVDPVEMFQDNYFLLVTDSSSKATTQ